MMFKTTMTVRVLEIAPTSKLRLPWDKGSASVVHERLETALRKAAPDSEPKVRSSRQRITIEMKLDANDEAHAMHKIRYWVNRVATKRNGITFDSNEITSVAAKAA